MKALTATARAALLEAWANRSGFWTGVVAMVVNDVVWVLFWVVFFERVGSVRGWEARGVLMLLAIFTTSAGFVLGVLYNARAVGRLAAEGEIDAALSLPVAPLGHLLVRKVSPQNLGDVAFGVGLFAFAGEPSLERTAIYVFGVVVSIVLLTGFLVASGSLAFFAGRNDAGELSFHAMFMFAAYPADVFGGAAKVMLYTIIPAAFVSAVPARLVDDFDPATAAAAAGVAAVFAFLGWALFTAGLRRYTSGAVWTRA